MEQNRSREDYQKIIDESKKQFEMMEATKHNMDIAREFQELTLNHAKEEIKKFPEVKEKPVVIDADASETNKKPPVGVG